uniref:Uncharacterized protein n=1 Tax=Triticum urartu TaxID=4572 RepID=A0A8R7TG32_TRIUA
MNVGVVVLGEIFNDRTWRYSLFGVVRLGVNVNGKLRCTGTAETTDRGLGQEVKETQRRDLRQEGEAEEVEVEHEEAGRRRGSRRGATTPWRFGNGKETESCGRVSTDDDAIAGAKGGGVQEETSSMERGQMLAGLGAVMDEGWRMTGARAEERGSGDGAEQQPP